MVHHLTATGRHLPYGITQCYLPPDTSECAAALARAMQAGTRFKYPGGMEGWVDIVDLIAPQPGVEPATFRSRVRHWTATPLRQLRRIYLELLMKLHHKATECHLPYGITQCYLPPDTSENILPQPQPDRPALDLPTPKGWKTELT